MDYAFCWIGRKTGRDPGWLCAPRTSEQIEGAKAASRTSDQVVLDLLRHHHLGEEVRSRRSHGEADLLQRRLQRIADVALEVRLVIEPREHVHEVRELRAVVRLSGVADHRATAR